MGNKVLIAEDDADIRKLLVVLLKQHGIDASEARDGVDAIDRLRDEQWDLAVVDLVMPRSDGYVVIRYLEEQLPNTHAIVISGARAEELSDVGRSRAVDAVLAKPLDVEKLVTQIRESLAAR
jgi:DNA-binding response OmpR family regulator